MDDTNTLVNEKKHLVCWHTAQNASANNNTLTICIISVGYVKKSDVVFLFQLVLANRTSNRNSTFILLCQNDKPVEKKDIAVRLPTPYNFLQATLCEKPKQKSLYNIRHDMHLFETILNMWLMNKQV